ncbi:hypothetical protein CUMW_174830 [Citrus unshiu]|uniref:Uncharacterized protein n=1 Tax=Citrus unshiu TaxID=55188 RepID=A0A2H5PWU6_CITUN|nr:hypothetical protein CUMW_174830 [Citrus unshiu]
MVMARRDAIGFFVAPLEEKEIRDYGTWKFLDSTNNSSRFRDFRKSNGNSIIELVSNPTKIGGVHYVQNV